MTPCEKLGYKVGDKFIVTENYVFAYGSIIELEHDDGSEGPLFKLISGSCKYNNAKGKKAGAYCDLYYVQKIEDKEMTHQKKPHVHAEMMKTHADDVSLCAFVRLKRSGDWCESSKPVFNDSYSYFLCLPKHKEACLHWLNGGLIECNSKLTNGWEDCADYNECFWKLSCGMMREDANYRIKPRKEKRWIAVHNVDSSVVLNVNFKSINEAKDATHGGNWQFIEIEVEV